MKKLFYSLFLLLLISAFMSGQSVSFMSPANGATYTSNNEGSTIAVYFSYGRTLTPYPPAIGLASYVRLITENGQYDNQGNNNIPNYFYLTPNTYTWRLELMEKFLNESGFTVTAEATVTFIVKYTIKGENNFGGGVISIDEQQVSSGSAVLKFIGETVSFSAIDQNDGSGYYRVWNTNGTNISCWMRGRSVLIGTDSRNYSYTVQNGDNGAIFTADLKKVCNGTFTAPGGSSIYADGATGNNSVTIQKVEGNPIYANAGNYTQNGIEYTMLHWQNGGETYPRYMPVTISSHATFKAVFDNGRPDGSLLNQRFGTVIGDPITVYWDENPNLNVTVYQVWRRVCQNNVWEPEMLIGTHSRGEGVHVDYGYNLCAVRQDIILEYCVKAYYSTFGTWGAWGWDRIYGEVLPKQEEDKITFEKALPNEYKIGNYPNPFNPSTTINYQMPEAGFVTVRVYNIIGKEVSELVKENKSAGYYSITFNGSKLSSGIYFCTMQAGKYFESRRMILAK